MNKRQRKKKFKKEYHVGIDLSSMPDITVLVPKTLLATIFKEPINIMEHKIIHGTGNKKPIGILRDGGIS